MQKSLQEYENKDDRAKRPGELEAWETGNVEEKGDTGKEDAEVDSSKLRVAEE